MATETGPDLSVAREQVERLMDDTCTIVRFGDPAADTLDLGTGELSTPPGEPTTIYDGRCKASPSTESQPRLTTEGGVAIMPRPYKLSIPADSPEPKIGDLAVITSSRRDAELVDTEFIVKDVLRSTFLVSRRMIVERRQ